MKIIKCIFVIIFMLLQGYSYSQWVKTSIPLGGNVFTMTNMESYLLAGTLRYGLSGTSSGIYRSNDNGVTWSPFSLSPKGIFTIIKDSLKLLAGTDDGFYVSTDGGSNWYKPNPGFHNQIRSLAIKGQNVFQSYGNVKLSTNYGGSWNDVLLFSTPAVGIIGNNIIAGTFNNGIFRSTNNGTNWVNVISSSYSTNNFITHDEKMFAAKENGLFVSNDSGQTWLQLYNNFVNHMTWSGTNLICGGTNGISITTDNGNNWVQKNEGLGSNTTVNYLLVSNGILYAAIDSNIWRRPITEVIGIEQLGNTVPNEYKLSQNYPNPFNPKTNIEINIVKNGFVKVSVFDVLGKEIINLINQELQAGSYKVDWDATNYPSGIYFYRLEANDFIKTKKMVLSK